MQNLTGKVALITGGTSGIGAATAIRLTAQGAHVAIVGSGKSAAEAECVRRRIEENGASCLVIAADLSEPANVTASVQQTVAEFGRLDILVHSAGGPAPGGLFEVSEAVWYRAFDIHIHAIFHLCRAAVPVMQGSSEGAIILISSAAGLRGCLGAAAYGVVKELCRNSPECWRGTCR
ncbi:MAG: SDR family NAD(P)-dependent oxidoreductase [Bryobacteraceae bacterium]